MTNIGRYCTLLILSASSNACLCFAQPRATPTLQSGFGNIQLNTPIDKVAGARLSKKSKQKDELPKELHRVVGDAYKKIAGIKIKKVIAEVYKGLIYEINIVTVYNDQLMDSLKKQYGPPSYNMRKNQYTWSSTDTILAFEKYKRKIILTYTSLPMQQLMKVERLEKLSNIKDDL